jgi:hypothetical protein
MNRGFQTFKCGDDGGILNGRAGILVLKKWNAWPSRLQACSVTKVQHTANRDISSFSQDGCHDAIKLYNNNASAVLKPLSSAAPDSDHF